MKTNVKQIGEIGVDTGLCWIGDPCYILHQEVGATPKAIGKDWGEFCNILHKDDQYPTTKQLNYDLGHPGLGVVLSTGYGDGVYPVFAQFGDEGRIAKVWVEFMDEEDPSEAGEDANPLPAPRSGDSLNAPWTMHFDRDGAEDIALICDSKGHDLATSRPFWLPEGDDPTPPTLAAMRLMGAAPKLLAKLAAVAELRRRWRSQDESETIDSIEYMDGLDALDLDAIIAEVIGRVA